MKILYINALYAPHIGGGAEITLKTLAENIKAQGHEVVVLATGPKPGLNLEEVDGVRVWRAGIRNFYFHHGNIQPPRWKRILWHALDIYNPFMQSYVRQVVEGERPDLASCHNMTGWSVAAWDALTKCRVPIVQVLHDQYLLCAKSTMFRGNDLCRKQCLSCRLMRLPHSEKSNQVRTVVGVSRFILEKFISNGYFQNSPGKEVIHNARNFPFDPAVLPPRAADGNVVFGFIGTLAPNKGVELLLETFSRIAKPNWRLRIAGSGNLQYEAKLKARFLDARIEFLGRCEQKEFFCSVDATVVPSLLEDTFPGVVFESLMFGAPVIGSKRGGVPEMVIPEETGVLFDPKQPGSLARRMQHVSDNIDHFRAMHREIRRQGARFGDLELWARKWLDVYQRTFANSSSLGPQKETNVES